MNLLDDLDATSRAFCEFLTTIKYLRDPGGCPWDQEQTPQSMRTHLLEEVYETLEAIDADDAHHVREEVGDVLLILGMLSLMYAEKSQFTMHEVLTELTAKLIRRHPHVFGDKKVDNAAEALQSWEKIKVEIEGRQLANTSVLDGIPLNLPPLERAFKMQKIASKQGFDWPEAEGAKQKIFEELEEVATASNAEQQEEELGDLMFAVVNYLRHHGVDPAVALHRSNIKFEQRFRNVEKNMQAAGISMNSKNMPQMDSYWEASKKNIPSHS